MNASDSFRTVVAILWVGIAYGQTPTAYPPSTPFLRIETGMHTAVIRGIDVDAAERFLVTASEDKTARVWDLHDGKLLQILRPPQGEGSTGKLYAAAISPDGNTIAVGGFTGPVGGPKSVYLFDRASGKLTRSIPGFPEVIDHLSYSSDGRYLAVALGTNSGIRVYRASDNSEVARDTDYGDTCYWAEFDRSGRLATASLDGFVRLYDENFHLIAKKTVPGGKRPYSARFSPNGSQVAIGFDDTTSVNVLSGRDLSFLYAAETPRGNGDLSKVAWSRDGRTLYAAGRWRGASDLCELVSWKGRNAEPGYRPISEDTPMDIRSLSSGGIGVASADPSVGVLKDGGGPAWQHLPEILDQATPAGRVNLSSDSAAVEFGFFTLDSSHGGHRHLGRFDLALRQASFDDASNPSLNPPKTTGLDLKDWHSTDHPTLNGRALPLEKYELSRSLAVSSDQTTFLLGTEWYLRLFESSGKQRWRADVPAVAWSVNLTTDGRFAVAALGDGTVRWYRTDDGREVMGLFVHPDGQRWVLWTPEGFFDSSPNADSLIGYHLNRGPDHEGEFVQVEQLKKLFYRPDLLAQRLKPGSDEVFRTELARIGDLSNILHTASPPELALLSPPETTSDGTFTFKFRITDHGNIVYRVDGIESNGRDIGPEIGKDTVERVFDLPPARHTVCATAFDKSNQLESRSVCATVNVKSPPQQQSALYVLAVGVSQYRDSSLNQGVKFAADDATAIATSLKQRGKGLFRDVITRVLTNGDASRENIESSISELAARIQPADEFILYLAGHGKNIDGKYTFVTANAIYSNLQALHDQSLYEERLQAMLRKIRATKTLLLLDTCSAGAAIPTRDLGEKGSIERLASLTGRGILAATKSDEVAIEVNGHGAFTYAVLDALTNAFDGEGLIQVSLLADRVEKMVPELTRPKGVEQFPMRLIQGQTFPVARKQQ